MWTPTTPLSLLLPLLLLLSGGLGSSCVDPAPEPWPRLGAFRCTAGETVPCPCPLGGAGTSTCQPDGETTGPCTCPEVTGGDAGVSTVSPDTGNSGGNGGGTTRTNPPEDTFAPEDISEPVADVTEDTGPAPEPTGGACVNELQETNVLDNIQELEEYAWSQGGLCNESSPTDIVGCVQNAMADGYGLSNGCSLCFAGYVVCTLASCASPCANYVSPQCLQCRNENCIPDWQTCMGF